MNKNINHRGFGFEWSNNINTLFEYQFHFMNFLIEISSFQISELEKKGDPQFIEINFYDEKNNYCFNEFHTCFNDAISAIYEYNSLPYFLFKSPQYNNLNKNKLLPEKIYFYYKNFLIYFFPNKKEDLYYVVRNNKFEVFDSLEVAISFIDMN